MYKMKMVSHSFLMADGVGRYHQQSLKIINGKKIMLKNNVH